MKRHECLQSWATTSQVACVQGLAAVESRVLPGGRLCLFVCLFGNPPASPITEDIPSFSILGIYPLSITAFTGLSLIRGAKLLKGDIE